MGAARKGAPQEAARRNLQRHQRCVPPPPLRPSGGLCNWLGYTFVGAPWHQEHHSTAFRILFWHSTPTLDPPFLRNTHSQTLVMSNSASDRQAAPRAPPSVVDRVRAVVRRVLTARGLAAAPQPPVDMNAEQLLALIVLLIITAAPFTTCLLLPSRLL